MRQAAITKLIIWSAVAVLLIAVLTAGLLTGGFFLPFLSFSGISSGGFYENSADYTIGSYISDTAITDLEIHWSAGRVILEMTESDTLTATESGNSSEETTMRYLLRDGKLILRDYPTTPWFHWNTSSLTGKVLTVKIPQSMELSRLIVNAVSAESSVSGIGVYTLELDTVSGGVKLENATLRDLKLDTVSGQIDIRNVTAAKVEIDTVSGDVSYQGNTGALEFSTVSGDLNMVTTSLPAILEIDSTSGRATLTGETEDGFILDFDSVSGDFECDYPVRKTNGTYICGNGIGDYEFDSVSGDLIIRQPA